MHDVGRDDQVASWVDITGANARIVRTNSPADHPAGARFVAVLDVDGAEVAWWPSEAWADPNRAEDVMAALWAAATGDEVVYDDEFDLELRFPLRHGQVRADPRGTYVRLTHADGSTVDGGSARWTAADWVDDPQGVMGAILRGAAFLNR